MAAAERKEILARLTAAEIESSGSAEVSRVAIQSSDKHVNTEPVGKTTLSHFVIINRLISIMDDSGTLCFVPVRFHGLHGGHGLVACVT